MKCPKCDKEMIQRDTGVVLASNPPQYPWQWWCGGCDHYEVGGVRRGVTIEDYYRQQWEMKQKEGK